ncbi:MAG: hypothetical protein C4535_14430 [Comamonadaceae bacterium]|nr:MAG: hypothetical protein C4535_14430 [Comamonadaceae bacterium]
MSFSGGKVLVNVSDIIKEPSWQVREKLTASRVKAYRTSYNSGADMPPVRLADVRGALYLVDGWHRMAAQEELSRKQVEATIMPMTRKEAMWAAASANLTHGEAYRKDERRKAFSVFITTKQHVQRGKPLSYREMAAAFGGNPSHVTLRNWIKQDFPDVFRALEKHRSGEWSPDMIQRREVPSEEVFALGKVDELLAKAVGHARAISAPSARRRLAAMVERAQQAIERGAVYAATPIENDDF